MEVDITCSLIDRTSFSWPGSQILGNKNDKGNPWRIIPLNFTSLTIGIADVREVCWQVIKVFSKRYEVPVNSAVQVKGKSFIIVNSPLERFLAGVLEMWSNEIDFRIVFRVHNLVLLG